jgi:hypothetical protein
MNEFFVLYSDGTYMYLTVPSSSHRFNERKIYTQLRLTNFRAVSIGQLKGGWEKEQI